MGVTVHANVMSGFSPTIQGVLSASTGACATDVLGHPKAGVNIITYDGGVGGYTLASPVTGQQSPPLGTAASLGTTGEQGDDGKILEIQNTTAHAHVVTAGAGKINGNKNTITFAAAGDCIGLRAYGGVWYTVYSIGTATLGGA